MKRHLQGGIGNKEALLTRRCMQRGTGKEANKKHRLPRPLKLDQPLGIWKNTNRTTLYRYMYDHQSKNLYLCEEKQAMKLKQTQKIIYITEQENGLKPQEKQHQQ